MLFDPALTCASLIGFGLIMYVILDGLDLGIGIMFMWAPNDNIRNEMMSSIAPVWDGNATWLIYGGGVLFAAFPLAYAIILEALYIPLIIMIIALMFRGVAFEFRMKAKSRYLWDWSFTLGSIVTASMQGLMLGAMIEGFQVANNSFIGSSFSWLTPFSITTSFATIMGYSLLGITWLIMKTQGCTRIWALELLKPITFVVASYVLMVSLKTPLAYPDIAAKWFSWPNIFYLSPIPILTTYTLYIIWNGADSSSDYVPFLSSVFLLLLCFLGLGISLYPYIIMPNITIWQAAAPETSLKFVLVLMMFSLPIVLGYTFLIYRLFRGKINQNTIFY